LTILRLGLIPDNAQHPFSRCAPSRGERGKEWDLWLTGFVLKKGKKGNSSVVPLLGREEKKEVQLLTDEAWENPMGDRFTDLHGELKFLKKWTNLENQPSHQGGEKTSTTKPCLPSEECRLTSLFPGLKGGKHRFGKKATVFHPLPCRFLAGVCRSSSNRGRRFAAQGGGGGGKPVLPAPEKKICRGSGKNGSSWKIGIVGSKI